MALRVLSGTQGLKDVRVHSLPARHSCARTVCVCSPSNSMCVRMCVCVSVLYRDARVVNAANLPNPTHLTNAAEKSSTVALRFAVCLWNMV